MIQGVLKRHEILEIGRRYQIWDEDPSSDFSMDPDPSTASENNGSGSKLIHVFTKKNRYRVGIGHSVGFLISKS